MPRKLKEHPWLTSYPKAIPWDVSIVPQPVGSLLDQAVSNFPDRPAFDFFGRTHSFKALAAEVNRFAKGLQSLGVGKGVKVGLLLPNSPYYVMAYYAVLKTGATIVNCNPLYTFTELRQQILDTETSLLITLSIQSLFKKATSLEHATDIKHVIVADFLDSLPFLKRKLFSWFHSEELAVVPYGLSNLSWKMVADNDGVFEAPEIDVSAPAVLQYTGGSTGTPKTASLTHANVYANAVQCGMWFSGLEEGREKIVAVLPFFHAFAMTGILNLSILKGCEMILHPRFDLELLLNDIRTKRPTLLFAVPTILLGLSRSPRAHKELFSSLKYCVSGGAPLLPHVKTRFEEVTGVPVIEGYGLTEASPVVAVNPLETASREGSVGFPLPATIIEIRDPKGRHKLLETGEVGEICVTGPQVMSGYHAREVESKAIVKSGRLHTGDLGYLDADGFLYVVDRLKEVIICGGYNIYPREIEEILYQHPAILDAAVLGVEDDKMGEVPKAYVCLKEGHVLSEGQLFEFLSGKITKKKIPRSVEFCAELPKTFIGKISKKDLKAGAAHASRTHPKNHKDA